MGFGSVLSGIGSVAGAFLGYKGAKAANAANLSIAERNFALQREFAQHGIRWKVADAKAAGIHPLAALGANVSSPGVVGVNLQNRYSGLGSDLADAGQNIGRAIDAVRNDTERYEAKVRELNLENMELQNESIRTDIHRANNPPMPVYSNEHDGVYGVGAHKKGIQRGYLEPVTVDSEGNRLLHLGQGPEGIVRIPQNVSIGEKWEEYLGEIGSLPGQVGLAGHGYGDWSQRRVDDLVSGFRRWLMKQFR